MARTSNSSSRAKKSKTSQGQRSKTQGPKNNLRANDGKIVESSDYVDPLLDRDMSLEIAAVVLAIFSIVSFIAVIGNAKEPISGAIAGFFHLGFGLGAYVLPIALLLFAASLFLRDKSPFNMRTLLGCSLIFISVLGIFSLLVPYTNLSTAGMFEKPALITSGGYVGAFIASFLQNTLGKTISFVLLTGLIIVGLVVIGFSVSALLQRIVDKTRELIERRHVEVNNMPWGDRASVYEEGSPAYSDPGIQGAAEGLLDDAGEAPTSFLGSRQGSVLHSALDDDEQDEDPFIDVSAQIAAEQAQTTLIPIADRMPESKDDDQEAGQVETPDGLKPIPSFLQAHADDSQKSNPKDSEDTTQNTEDANKASSKKSSKDDVSEDTQHLQLPPMSMLRHNPKSAKAASTNSELEQTAGSLQATLTEFGLHSQVVGWISGPTVTTFKVQPGEGERVSRISNLEDDIALSLAAQSVRIFAPIPGTSLVGIEIPNAKRQNVNLGDVLPYAQEEPLELAIGRDAEGTPVVADLAKMPHLLIAGTTGSGKSVMINSIVMTLLMRTLPEDVRLIMVDPKRVELSGYNGLPHLYVPVVTEPKQAASALQWGVSEMERRLKVFERLNVRNIATFNAKQQAGAFEDYDNPPQKMPYLVIIVDELSDLMMVAGKDVEASIVRIAQLGRAAGIHLIVATQRPSSNVVTGLIKANITNRIAFNVATGIDSRVIIDQVGAEKLTGYGDMLFSKVDWGKPKRIQGCFVSDDEINSVVEFVKEQGSPDYHEEILSAVSPAHVTSAGSGGSFYNEPTDDDPLLWDAAKIVVDSQLGSTSGLQRRLKVGYARAGRIMDMLEEKGIVGPPDGSKPREVLLDAEGLISLRAVEEQLSEEEIMGGM